MSNPLLRNLTAEERTDYLRDGIVLLRQIIAPEWVELTRQAMDEMRQNPSPYATLIDNEQTLFYAEQLPSLFSDKLLSVRKDSGLAEISRQLYPELVMRWVYDQLWYKGAGKVAETPWHQDTAYSYYEGLNIVRLWMPVDPVPRQTTIEIVRGSHLWNVVYATATPKVLEDNKDNLKEGSFSYTNRSAEDLPEVPDIEALRDSFDIVGFEVQPGDVVAFNYHVLHHAGAGFNAHNMRRTYAVVFADEQSTLKRRPNVVPGVIEHVGRTYQDGQRISDFADLFPPA